MVTIYLTENFKNETKKLDNSIKIRLGKVLDKIIDSPEIGKHLMYNLKGERSVRLHPFRVVYTYERDIIHFLRFEHRQEVYK